MSPRIYTAGTFFGAPLYNASIPATFHRMFGEYWKDQIQMSV